LRASRGGATLAIETPSRHPKEHKQMQVEIEYCGM
jgi:hypothetical protein